MGKKYSKIEKSLMYLLVFLFVILFFLLLCLIPFGCGFFIGYICKILAGNFFVQLFASFNIIITLDMLPTIFGCLFLICSIFFNLFICMPRKGEVK